MIPRARNSELAGVRDNAVLVRVAAPPVEGAANDALVEFIAKTIGVPRRAVQVVSGETSRIKRLAIQGVDEARVRAALLR